MARLALPRIWLPTGVFIISVISMLVLAAPGCKEGTPINADDIANPAVTPRVASSYPAGGSSGPYNLYDIGPGRYMPNFVIVFNKLMVKSSFTSTSVRATGFDQPTVVRVEAQYYYPGLTKSAGTSSIYYDNVLAFFISDSQYYRPLRYKIGNSYTIHMDSTIEDINGNHLSHGFSFTYIPEPSFRVIEFSPLDGSKNVSTSVTPSVTFNAPLDQSILGKLHITPEIGGAWIRDTYYSVDSSQVNFVASQVGYPFRTSFTVSVDPSAMDADHHPINHEYHASFSTETFRVNSTYPRDGDLGVSLSSNIWVQFSGRVDTGTVSAGFVLSPVTPGILYLYSGASYFTFQPSTALAPKTKYSISIPSTIKAFDGTPCEPHTTTFTTDDFRINYGYPYPGSTSVPRTTRLTMYTNAPLLASSVASSVTISPAVNGAFDIYDGSTQIDFIPSALLDANTTYSVTVSTGLQTTSGYHLPQSYTYFFSTGSN